MGSGAQGSTGVPGSSRAIRRAIRISRGFRQTDAAAFCSVDEHDAIQRQPERRGPQSLDRSGNSAGQGDPRRQTSPRRCLRWYRLAGLEQP